MILYGLYSIMVAYVMILYIETPNVYPTHFFNLRNLHKYGLE